MRYLIKPFLLILSGLFGQAVYSQSISVTNLVPYPNQVVGDTVPISIAIQSGFPIDTASASVYYTIGTTSLQTEARLSYNPLTGFFSGLLLLTGLDNGPLTININVEDSTGGIQVAPPLPIIHNSQLHSKPGALPQISITEPLSYSVARPILHFQARATATTDSSMLTLFMVIVQPTGTTYNTIGQYPDSIDVDLDLSPYQGMAISLIVDATDRNNQSATTGPIPVFVETSPALKEYFSSTGNILDFNYNKLLVVNYGAVSHARIVDAVTGVSSNIPFGRYVTSGYLTSQGAVFGVSSLAGTYFDSLYDYNNGILRYLGLFNKGSLKVAGSYAIWTTLFGTNPPTVISDSLFLRNLSTGINSLVAPNIVPNINGAATKSDLTANGMVAYVDSSFSLVSYINNSYTQLAAGSRIAHIGMVNPLTDGFNFAYTYVDETLDNIKVAGEQPGILTNAVRGYLPQGGKDYQVNNKFVAYVKINPDRSPPTTLWLRDSSGNSVLVTTNALVDLLNPKGDIMFDTKTRELALRNGQIIQVSSLPGQTYYRDSSWYVAIGRTLFKLDFSSFADTVSNSSIYVAEDSAYPFKQTDFTGHFSGSGQLATIKIIRLPANGTLSKAGVPVRAGDEIAFADLAKLSFMPNTGFIGTDTLQWNASNGIAYTPAAALIYLRVITRPAIPVLSGLDTAYCISAGLQKIKISNFPDTFNGDTVAGKLDGGSLTVNGADSSFSFNTTTLSIGAHTLIVSFTNLAGISADTQHFNIQAAVTPVVHETANIYHVINLIDSVKLTASNAFGGGTSPLYSFASDGNFVNILQGQSSNNSLTIAPGKLAVGNNWIFVKMKTSESCYAVQNGMDSVNIVRDLTTGIIDADYPGQVIEIFPNPFKDQVTINGLNSAKRYLITLLRANGQLVFSAQVDNQTSLNIPCGKEASGVYILTIYDEKRNRVLGTIKLLKAF